MIYLSIFVKVFRFDDLILQDIEQYLDEVLTKSRSRFNILTIIKM